MRRHAAFPPEAESSNVNLETAERMPGSGEDWVREVAFGRLVGERLKSCRV